VALKGPFLFNAPIVVDKISSTQDVVKEDSFEPFTPLVALSQTAGRGRKGNQWYSPPKAGLYLSVKFPKEVFGTELGCISLVAGWSVSKTVDSYILSKIKWPNDVYVNGKKVAGILTEVSKGFVVIGIGVNLNVKSFPGDLKKWATSIFLETQTEVDFEEFLELLLVNLNQDLNLFREKGFLPFVELINRKLLWRSKRVFVGNERGKLLGINSKGFAVLRTCYGKIKEFPYGELSLRPDRKIEGKKLAV